MTSAAARMPWKTPYAVSTRRVTGAAVSDGPPGDVAALARDEVHVLAERADVAGGVVAAGERLHEAAVGPQQCLGLHGGRVSDDDGLAAAEVQPCQRGLVRHALRQVQDVLERSLLGGVGVEAGAAECGAESGGVDRDDRAQAGGLVVAEDDLFVACEPGEDAVGPRCLELGAHQLTFRFRPARVGGRLSRSGSRGGGAVSETSVRKWERASDLTCEHCGQQVEETHSAMVKHACQTAEKPPPEMTSA